MRTHRNMIQPPPATPKTKPPNKSGKIIIDLKKFKRTFWWYLAAVGLIWYLLGQPKFWKYYKIEFKRTNYREVYYP